MPPNRVAEIISPVASALDAAHRAGLLHRDVKPSNMLMDVLPGRPDHVYLSDFGLSKAATSTSGMTRAGEVMGTLDYMSPEQIGGKSIDGRVDQYALACSAFELLTGAPPFRRDEPSAVMYAHISESPPRLTSRRAGLPQAVDGVLSRALAKGRATGMPAAGSSPTHCATRSASSPTIPVPESYRRRAYAHRNRPARPPGRRRRRRAGHGNEHPRQAERLHRP